MTSKPMNAVELVAWALRVDQNFDVMPDDWKKQAQVLIAGPPDETSEDLDAVIADVRDILAEFNSEDVRMMARRAIDQRDRLVAGLREIKQRSIDDCWCRDIAGPLLRELSEKTVGEHPPECGCPVCDTSNRGDR